MKERGETMKRLRDEAQASAMDPTVARAARLLAATEPLAEVPGRPERVRARLGSARPTRAAWLLRPATVLGGLLAMAAAASAMIGRHLWTERSATRGSAVAPASAPSSSGSTSQRPVPPTRPLPGPPRASLGVAAQAPSGAPIAPSVSSTAPRPTPAPAAPPATSTPPHAAQTHLAAPPSNPRAVRSPSDMPAAPRPDESAIVLAAVRALRKDHDPARAGVILDDYLTRFPTGGLVEEARALQIEAAAARGDAQAADLARHYLERYPDGRYRDVAQRLATPQP